MELISSPIPSIIQQQMENCIEKYSFQHQYKDIEKNQQKNHDQEMISSVKVQLNSANQILPAHKKIKDHKEKISFKLSSTTFYKESNKLNQTVFPSLSFKIKDNLYQNKNRDQLSDQAILKEELGQFSFLINEKKVLIYQRIKNQKMNYLSKSQKTKQKALLTKIQSKYYCSLFINPKLAKNKSFQRPIWQYLKDQYQIEDPKIISDPLQFDSSFEGGNLFAVFKDNGISFPTYELFMQNDINTKGSTQWFYFKITNKMRMKAKFRILNFYKASSLYQMGMKILVSVDGIEWKRVGTAINYLKNDLNNKDSYSLQFMYEFQGSGKSFYFSYGYPYNYSSKLISFIQSIQDKNYSKKCIKKISLCKSTMGNQIYMLSISNNALFMKSPKPIIYVIGRQHAGQTPGSFVMEGFINFILSNRIEAQALRQEFQFKIVPMVNVDGVISGNYRTNISGNDVNRQWIFPSRNLHPQIYYLKQEILSNKRNVIYFLDIHSHSRKMNSFFYGSKQITRSNKFYPFVCSKLNKSIKYTDSAFCDDPSKMSTARVVIQKQLNLINSLTFQVSFFGWTDSIKKTKHHFKISELQEIGISLALGLYYCQISIKRNQQMSQSNIHKRNDKQKTIYKNSLKIYQKWKLQLEKQIKNEEDNISDGSSIDPQQFTLKKQEILNVENQNYVLVQHISPQIMSLSQNQKDNYSQKKKILNFFDNPLTDTNKFQFIKGARRYLRTDKKQSFEKEVLNNQIGLNDEQIDSKKSNLFSHSGNEFFMMSSKNFMVRQLQGQLQGKSKLKDRKYLSIDQQSMIRRPASIDFKQTYRYHDKIKEIKKTFNYCINNDTSIQNYHSYYKTYTPQMESNSEFGKITSSLSKQRKSIDTIFNQSKTIQFGNAKIQSKLSLGTSRKSFSLKKEISKQKSFKI